MGAEGERDGTAKHEPVASASQTAGSSAVPGGGPSPALEEKCGPFVLGEGLPPIPARLVGKIRKGEFVDMADLLRDNLEADRRRGRESEESSPSPSARSTRREVPDLLSWSQCFCTYTAVIAEKQPGQVKQLLAYQATLLREARRCGGNGWRAYDAMFRQLTQQSTGLA